MLDLAWLLVAVVLAYVGAAAAPRVRERVEGRVGAIVGWGLVGLVAACPLVIPPGRVGLRAIAAFVAGDLMFKMVEGFWRRSRGGRGMSPRAYDRFLIPFPVLAVVFPEQRRRLIRPARVGVEPGRVAGGVVGVVVALGAVRFVSGIDAVRSSFALNHALMLMTFVLAVESLSRALCGLERLAGFDTTPIIRDAYPARTVAAFWRRYNNRVHAWLVRHVGAPAGGRRAPGRSVFLVFLVSGLFHEAMFAVATSRLTGFQLAFFLLQAPAVLASGALERLARRGGMAGQIVAHGTTIVFLAVTSVLFFDGVRRVFPFIYGR